MTNYTVLSVEPVRFTMEGIDRPYKCGETFDHNEDAIKIKSYLKKRLIIETSKVITNTRPAVNVVRTRKYKYDN